MSVRSWLLGHTLPYRLWQAPFAEQKFAPVARQHDLSTIGRVLDVACGPGTNARHFADADYLGVDINEEYVAYASRRYGPRFLVADVTRHDFDGRFDFILANSFFHHLDDHATLDVLRHLEGLLEPEGSIHILDLVLPRGFSVARGLARMDRGDYPRPLEEWRSLFRRVFEEVSFEPYPLGIRPVTLWNMVYFKGRPRP